jgi:tRNA threonylcarbamoyladenosine biosynthesis protein TsaE
MEPLNVRFECDSPEATFALGVKLGRALTASDFVGLDGALGAGKTLFARGVAQGAGIAVDDVSSPTYAILQSYRGRLTLHHADLYRLTGEDDLFSTGYFEVLDTEGALVVEWASKVSSAIPVDALMVKFEVTGLQTRRLTCVPTGPRSSALLGRWRA